MFKEEIAEQIEVPKIEPKKTISPNVKDVFKGEKVSSHNIKKVSTTVYFPEPVKDQLEEIQFSERKSGVNQNDLILEGIDLLFKKRGFPSIKKLLS